MCELALAPAAGPARATRAARGATPTATTTRSIDAFGSAAAAGAAAAGEGCEAPDGAHALASRLLPQHALPRPPRRRSSGERVPMALRSKAWGD